MKYLVLLLAVLLIVGAIYAQNINDLFPEVKSLKEEDEMDLRGMAYNETQPPVNNPNQFRGYRIGLLASHCFEECELTFPYIYFARRGAQVDVIGPWWTKDNKIAACEFVRVTRWAKRNLDFKQAQNIKYDALIVVGGVWSSTVVRNDGDAIQLLKNQYQNGRLVATVCSGSTVLINANLITPRMPLTGSPSIAIDLSNAGGNYLDVPTVRHQNIITGRSPQGNDSLLFCQAIDKYLTEMKFLWEDDE
ncbi:hypothetical protein ABK040_009418 [Willaertia magna]